jgi:alpha-mannosidase
LLTRLGRCFFVTAFIALSICCPMGRAQTVLTPQNAQTIEKLQALNRLSLAGWRFHEGDVPHGEAAGLDDSQWEAASGKTQVGNDAVWFRRTIEIPQTLDGYDLSGTRIWFQFHAGANGPMPEIIYFNGRRVALGEDLEPIVLFDGAKPGEKVVVAVKLLHTVDVKTFTGADARIDFVETRPSPTILAEEVKSAAILLPSIESNPAASEQQLNAAVAQIDTAALSKADQAAFDASLRKSQGQLELLRPVLEKVAIRLTGNSHIDAAWLWPWTESVDVVKPHLRHRAPVDERVPRSTPTPSPPHATTSGSANKYPE